ncbi:hypothetical protein BHE74_00032387, partial [Ensete ventricosum]
DGNAIASGGDRLLDRIRASPRGPCADPLRFLLLLRKTPLPLRILTAYFVILPLRDEGAISLGLDNLPGLFVGSLFLTLLAAPISTLVFSLPNIPKARV